MMLDGSSSLVHLISSAGLLLFPFVSFVGLCW